MVFFFTESLRKNECHLKDNQLIDSLAGRLEELKNESISRALRRYVSDLFPEDPSVVKIVLEAYKLRSQIIHGGKTSDPDVDLRKEIEKISNVMRKIYSKVLGLPLLYSADL